jgi:hypothetical protein
MAFSEYQTIEDVIKKYPLEILNEPFLNCTEIALPDLFLDNLNFALKRKTTRDNKFFLAENFIYPLLQLTWKNHEKLRVWSHQALRYDDDLYGEPDYFISYWPSSVIQSLISIPLLAIVEAKKQDFEKGWGQCLAEMIACQKINNDENLIIYGIVSTGIIWEFGQLQNSKFTQNTITYSLSNPQLLAGILDYIFGQCEVKAEEYQLKYKNNHA